MAIITLKAYIQALNSDPFPSPFLPIPIDGKQIAPPRTAMAGVAF